MNTATADDLQRWTEQLARDPDSLAYLELARAYRRQGRADAALRICLGGVERNPNHVEGHNLLGHLYFEAGDHARAASAWATVLRLDTDSFEARRGLGFCRMNSRDWAGAKRHLEAALRLRPNDRVVRDALDFVERRLHEQNQVPVDVRANGDGLSAAYAAVEHRRRSEPLPAVTASSVRREPLPSDPARLFGELRRDELFLGALVVDRAGLVMAGSLENDEASPDPEQLAALLAGAMEEAVRTSAYLEMGGWRGLTLETPDRTLYIVPVTAGAALLVVVRAGAPAGWLRKVATRARQLAVRFLDGGV